MYIKNITQLIKIIQDRNASINKKNIEQKFQMEKNITTR